MKIQENAELQKLNTFALQVNTRWLIEIESPSDLIDFIHNKKFNHLPRLVLGGGSNVLFSCDFQGVVLLMKSSGKKLISESKDSYYIECAAGENWHDFVQWTIRNGYQGLENLSLIPGTVGASPIQNIGAYGVEVKDLIESVEVFDLKSHQFIQMTNLECQFSYRDSIFKNELKNKVIITKVVFRLPKIPNYQLSYGDLKKELENKELNPLNISSAVIKIRQSKLPDPKNIGNAGSFFKNPIVSQQKAIELKNKFPAMVQFPSGNQVKLAAGWMIEYCGWKGKNIGHAGCYEKQALVLVNLGNATGQEIIHLANEIQKSVFEKFEVVIEPEPVFI